MTVRKAVGAVVVAGIVASSGYYFGSRSLGNLAETRPEVPALAKCALNHTKVDFIVVDGGRTLQEQITNVRNGVSWTLQSRHIEGAAIDVAAYVDGKVSYDPIYYHQVNDAFAYCSDKLRIPYVWGGSWKVRDLMHFELDRRFYP